MAQSSHLYLTDSPSLIYNTITYNDDNNNNNAYNDDDNNNNNTDDDDNNNNNNNIKHQARLTIPLYNINNDNLNTYNV